ncbi:hypothetical protein Daesc_010127 [Daldinia eschscholtzii]|uniref:Uncharacterized protein n=1 Tax=Daldinia eschscholtzii TaxID=292717 RepID=A0AAX6M832_9PEZI
MASPPIYKIFGVSLTGELDVLAAITDAPAAYINTLFSTENYLILTIWQADFKQQGKNLLSTFGSWDPNRKTLFYVPKAGGGVTAKYISDDAFFAFHEVNSFEDESEAINIDIPRMENLGFPTVTRIQNLRTNLGSKTNVSPSIVYPPIRTFLCPPTAVRK